MTQTTLYADPAMMRLDDLFRDVKANPQPSNSGWRQTREAIEDAILLCIGDSGAVIANGEGYPSAVRVKRDLDRRAGSVFHCVGQQVFEDLLHAQAVPTADDARLNIPYDRALGTVNDFAKARQHVPNQAGQVHFLVLEL